MTPAVLDRIAEELAEPEREHSAALERGELSSRAASSRPRGHLRCSCLHSVPVSIQDARVIFFLITGQVPYILLLTLVLALYLTVIELRELRPSKSWWAWWILLVVITHFIGYLILRAYVAIRRARSSRA
jgi:hypothetical protein